MRELILIQIMEYSVKFIFMTCAVHDALSSPDNKIIYFKKFISDNGISDEM